ncbi:hypothetical protein QSH18_10760 [Xanthomonas sp. NCPPB 2654]|uniref:hypothetical protein n=1 Tax=unclassified Xanthomonas TaxID=2643310 RepID=UPI0021DF7AA7|nr:MULTISPECIES: hypothetical protein [unclassified Xanthomonas]MDL5366086.1 hypothetical protein [Xanthomonas sp. NCPPB 2654]UYC20783.1 hypothetical protein NUG20_00260 [Xanthomonas sp. CFBP 8443]
MKVYFSDYFSVSPKALKEYGAFNVSLINDLPLFIDPFLLFNSEKKEYRDLHDAIIKYIRFLRGLSGDGKISEGHIKHLFTFKEVKQNWLGYSMVGNSGSGLGAKFAIAMNENLSTIFSNFGDEKITKGSHLEKLCLIKDGVGKDAISDFTTNLIKSYLCEYTQTFAEKHLASNRIKAVDVSHAKFNYDLRRWMPKRYKLPYIDGDYVLLTPKDILTKDEAWINRHDIVSDFEDVLNAVPNDVLRAQINDYFLRQIPDNAKKKDMNEAAIRAVRAFPQIIDYYIRYKEDNGDKAVAVSEEKLKETESQFISQVSNLIEKLVEDDNFYKTPTDTFEETSRRVQFLKQVIEKNDGYKIFYIKGKPVQREVDLQLMFRLTWFASSDDVNAEVNNGRGPVDYKISRGSKDATLVEFKLASNSKLKQNLAKQVEVYKDANQTKKSIKVVLHFTDEEYSKIKKMMKELKIKEGNDFVLIDASRTNKPSGSNAK